jgi:hypothetical protein
MCVYCEVGSEVLYVIYIKFVLSVVTGSQQGVYCCERGVYCCERVNTTVQFVLSQPVANYK